MPSGGACDFVVSLADDAPATVPIWTAEALPFVITLEPLPADCAGARSPLVIADQAQVLAEHPPDYVLRIAAHIVRLHAPDGLDSPSAAVTPVDGLAELRARALADLARLLAGKKPGTNPQALSPARRARLVLVIRALDARLEGASYRKIADALFGAGDLTGAEWRAHDLRDRTIRLTRYAMSLVNGGYRRLLLHPFRRRR